MSSPVFPPLAYPQTAFGGQGEAASRILELTWVLFIGGGLVFVAVIVAGLYRGQCAEFCGAQHAKMALVVAAQAPAEFDGWLQGRRARAAEPTTPLARRRQAPFTPARCGVCHTIRGTAADGGITDPRHIKPGVRMPALRLEEGDGLRALAAYLEGLR